MAATPVVSDPLTARGPISESAIRTVDRMAADQRSHASVEVSDDKSVTVEGGGTIKERIAWSAWAKKVWKGPWVAGSTWRW